MDNINKNHVREVIKKVSKVLMQECVDSLEEELLKKDKIFAREWIERKHLGCSNLILKELHTEDPSEFKLCTRMSPELFDNLLAMITPMIQRKDTFMRDALPARIKLEITLTYLASGSSYRFLQLFYRVSKSAISSLIPEVCDAISHCLQNYLKVITKN